MNEVCSKDSINLLKYGNLEIILIYMKKEIF